MRFIITLLMRFIITLLMFFPMFAAEPWSTKDKVFEGVYLVTLAADYSQTMNIRCDKKYYENNLLLGRHPRGNETTEYFVVSAVINAFITDRLSGDSRTLWQLTFIGVNIGFVANNYFLGVKFRV